MRSSNESTLSFPSFEGISCLAASSQLATCISRFSLRNSEARAGREYWHDDDQVALTIAIKAQAGPQHPRPKSPTRDPPKQTELNVAED
ncbi:unnamed protein product [Clonostachys solani]|uniref:Uncharacterized protein n=1 Tax=Clonostachys solani TaxID=160281 RepID=A0A9N9WA33_9HYPO|nr:unnamed protein product [Clonostachys solani]